MLGNCGKQILNCVCSVFLVHLLALLTACSKFKMRIFSTVVCFSVRMLYSHVSFSFLFLCFLSVPILLPRITSVKACLNKVVFGTCSRSNLSRTIFLQCNNLIVGIFLLFYFFFHVQF